MRWFKVGESSKVGVRTNKGYDVWPENSLRRWTSTRLGKDSSVQEARGLKDARSCQFGKMISEVVPPKA